MLSIWSGPKFCCLVKGETNQQNSDLSTLIANADEKLTLQHVSQIKSLLQSVQSRLDCTKQTV